MYSEAIGPMYSEAIRPMYSAAIGEPTKIRANGHRAGA